MEPDQTGEQQSDLYKEVRPTLQNATAGHNMQSLQYCTHYACLSHFDEEYKARLPLSSVYCPSPSYLELHANIVRHKCNNYFLNEVMIDLFLSVAPESTSLAASIPPDNRISVS